jgi:hypothetical protein
MLAKKIEEWKAMLPGSTDRTHPTLVTIQHQIANLEWQMSNLVQAHHGEQQLRRHRAAVASVVDAASASAADATSASAQPGSSVYVPRSWQQLHDRATAPARAAAADAMTDSAPARAAAAAADSAQPGSSVVYVPQYPERTTAPVRAAAAASAQPPSYEEALPSYEEAVRLFDLASAADAASASAADAASASADTDHKCCICTENAVNTALKPCYHAKFCNGCAVAVLGQTHPKCPICRVALTGKQKIYLGGRRTTRRHHRARTKKAHKKRQARSRRK